MPPRIGAEEADTDERVLQELGWLKEPESREAGMDSEEEVDIKDLKPKSAAALAAGLRGSDAVDASARVVGRPVGDRDLEMQPLSGSQDESAKPSRPERPKKELWRVWPSRSRFFCRGALMTGGETELGITQNCSVPNLCVWTCILGPSCLYFVWVFPTLWRQGTYAMPLATLVVFLMASGFLLATCCSDPGIIPRREVILATNSAAMLEAALGYDPLASKTVRRDGRDGGRCLPVELSSRGYRWCYTCRIVRPPRASHCPDCDNCVLRYDHHCPFVNNCVGQRNYHFFFAFVTSVLCLAFLVLPVLFWFLNSDDFESISKLGDGFLLPVFYTLIGLGCFVGLAVFLSLILWSYHLFLIATKRTTKEFRKNLPNIAEEPTLCATRGSRLFDPWAMVDARDLIREDEPPPAPPGTVCSNCFTDDD